MGVSLHGTRSTSRRQKTRLPGFQRRGGGLFQGAWASWQLKGTPNLHLGPLCCPGETPGGPLSTYWLPAVSPPVRLVQKTGRRRPGGQALGAPAAPHYLIEFLIVHLCPVQLRRMRSMPARPRFSTSRQRPVPLFIMAPFWVGGGEKDRQMDRNTERHRDKERKRQMETEI